MSAPARLDLAILGKVLAGVAFGTLSGLALLWWAVPAAPKGDFRPSVLSTLLVPLGCFVGWLFSGSRERAGTAAVSSFALYFLSAFAAARLRTLPAISVGTMTLSPATWNYFWLVVIVQALGGVVIAVTLAFLGRALPQVQRLQDARDVSGLGEILRAGSPAERREAARALGSLGGEGARLLLLAALDDADVGVVREALAALVGLAAAEDRPRLEALCRHTAPAIRRRARAVLRWLGKTLP